MPRLSLILTLSDSADPATVASKANGMGFSLERSDDVLGLLIGKADSDRLNDLRMMEEVVDITEDSSIVLPPIRDDVPQ